MIDNMLLEPNAGIAPSPVRLRIVTACGDIVIELAVDRAPHSSAAFLREVDNGVFDGGSFYRLVRKDTDNGRPTIEVVQAVCASTPHTLTGLVHESTDETGLRHLNGTVSLPRLAGGPGSASSFFICVGDQPALDAGGVRVSDELGFAAFGQVVSGMDLVEEIHLGTTLADAPHEFMRGQLAADPVTIHAIVREAGHPSDRLRRLAEDYWAFRIREFPLDASAAGVSSADALLDGVGESDHARRARLAEAMRKRVDEVDVSRLSPDDETTIRLLRGQLANIVEAFALDEHRRPWLFPFGFADLPERLARLTPLGSLAQRDAFAARLEALPGYMAQSLECLRAGFRAGYRVPRILVPRVLAMLDSQLSPHGLSATVDDRLRPDPSGVSATRGAEQRERIRILIADGLLPAIATVREAIVALGEESLTDSVGLCTQPGGRNYYRFKVRQQTSLDVEPDAVHEMGLAEVERVKAKLETLLVEMGRPGERDTVAAELEKIVAPDAASLLQNVRACAKQIEGRLPSLFGRFPANAYAVEQLEAAASVESPAGFARPAPANRSTPSIFWLTALPERCPLHLIVPLTLHEAWPGHLMQFGLAHELEGVPAFRRHGWSDYDGYVGGWAHYCERLGYEMKLYGDPADRFGLFTFELWRAASLVVDTGIHWRGWDRQQAIAYMAENTYLPLPIVEGEVDRYIGAPARALSYKLGERTITGLRRKAETKLGEGFSLSAFHDAVLATGPVSLDLLKSTTERWIEEQRKS